MNSVAGSLLTISLFLACAMFVTANILAYRAQKSAVRVRTKSR